MFRFARTTPSRLILSLFLVLVAVPLVTQAETALISTPLGDIEIELLEADAPQTVANFLNYVTNNRYDNTFMHRSVPGFIIQGGGFGFSNGQASPVTAFAPVVNEFKVSNTRGTVAMAKLGGDPNSATGQWFINLADNSGNLDSQNGGFTVFARVIGDGMEIADAIAQLQIVNAGGAFASLPVINFSGGSILAENLVMTVVTETIEDVITFKMNAGLNDAWFNIATDGQGFFITVFPQLGLVSLAWFTYDTTPPEEGATAKLGAPDHRWLTALGTIDGNTSVMEVSIASGGVFDKATEITRVTDGSITLTFIDCMSGRVDYNIPSIGRLGSILIRRVADDNIDLCVALGGED